LFRIYVLFLLCMLALFVVNWVKWLSSKRERKQSSTLSFLALLCASLSAGVALGGAAFAYFVHPFSYSDSSFVWLSRAGTLLALIALICGAVGSFRNSPIRWQSVALSMGMSLLWLLWISAW